MHSSRMCTTHPLTICHTCSPATHAPLPCMPPCHTCPLPCMPPLPYMPSLPHMPPLPWTLPTVDRVLDTHFWKYYLAPISLRVVIIRFPFNPRSHWASVSALTLALMFGLKTEDGKIMDPPIKHNIIFIHSLSVCCKTTVVNVGREFFFAS